MLSKKAKGEISQSEKRSILGRTSRNKGASFERTIAKIIQAATGFEFLRTPLSGGFAKNTTKGSEGFRGDIVPADKDVKLFLHIECKNTKTWSLPKWFEQAESDCPNGKIPVVVFHKHGTSRNYIALDLESFFRIVPSEKIAVKESK